MPRERIAATTINDGPGLIKTNLLQVSWMPRVCTEPDSGWNARGWAQVSIAPSDWKDTGDWEIVDLDAASIDHLIRTLKRVRRKAFPKQRQSR